MEGNCHSDTPPPPSLAVNTGGCGHELTRSKLNASSLTAESCRNVLRLSACETPDDCIVWTNEKHNSYLHNLEMSFVKQLQQSKSLLAQCSELKLRDISISKKQLTNARYASEQFNELWNGYRQKNNCARGEHLSCSMAPDSCTPLKRKMTYNFSCMGMRCPTSSAEMPKFLKLCTTMKHGKTLISHGLATSSHEFSPNNPSIGDLSDLTKEGMGQNFLDESNERTSEFESQAKRLKTASVDRSRQDQMVSSKNYPATNFSVINSSAVGEELVLHDTMTENPETFVCPPT